jgi:hypothetical protein
MRVLGGVSLIQEISQMIPQLLEPPVAIQLDGRLLSHSSQPPPGGVAAERIAQNDHLHRGYEFPEGRIHCRVLLGVDNESTL